MSTVSTIRLEAVDTVAHFGNPTWFRREQSVSVAAARGRHDVAYATRPTRRGHKGNPTRFRPEQCQSQHRVGCVVSAASSRGPCRVALMAAPCWPRRVSGHGCAADTVAHFGNPTRFRREQSVHCLVPHRVRGHSSLTLHALAHVHA